MFSRAIVRTPCKALVEGITSADLGLPNYENALRQHQHYVEALQYCGLDVTQLAADESFPDSTFVEDVALLTPNCAIITRPGAPSRTGEVAAIEPVIANFYQNIEHIIAPGCVEAGDIMMVGDHFYIGLSERNNQQGADQLIAILQKNDLSGSVVSFSEVLHLKTGINYLEDNMMLASGEFLTHSDFSQFSMREVPAGESYAANSVWINGKVLVPAGHPQTQDLIAKLGYEVVAVDVSEFQKIDGGLSCLSLRF